MEHPAEMLINNDNLNEKQALFELVFEKTPTYDQILNGTPKLTLVFELSTKNRLLEYSIARRLDFEWNTMERMILEWKYTLIANNA